jgi:ankyrin repeat protein
MASLAKQFNMTLVKQDQLVGAAIIGDTAVISKLIKKGLDVNFQDSKGETPLHWAAEHGRVNVVTLLLDSGAFVDICDEAGSTPLHKSSRNGHANVVALLLRYGAQVDLPDRGGLTGAVDFPLHTHFLKCQMCVSFYIDD